MGRPWPQGSGLETQQWNCVEHLVVEDLGMLQQASEARMKEKLECYGHQPEAGAFALRPRASVCDIRCMQCHGRSHDYLVMALGGGPLENRLS